MAESLARRLVEPGCAGQNALVSLGQHLTVDQARRQELGMAAGGQLAGHQAGAVLAPQTFNMQALLAEALAFSTASVAATAHAGAATSDAAVSNFHASASAPALTATLAASALPQSLPLLMMRGAYGHSMSPMLMGPPAAPQAVEQPSWGANFLAERDHLLVPEGASATAASAQLDDMDTDYQPEDRLTDSLEQLRAGTYTESDAEKDRFWEDLSRTWSQYMEDETTQGGAGALAAGSATTPAGAANREFVFQANNPHAEEADPLGAGLAAMRQGRVPEAVLLFEAAAARDPQSPAAWRHLGVSLAEAEREADAIAACQRCLAVSPGDRVALLSLARSFTNEMRNSEAVHALFGWLAANPAYADLASGQQPDASAEPVLGGFATYAEFSRCERLLLEAAARQEPGQPDPELQLALGVLYNLHGDYQRAVDSFKAALQVQPDDYLSWNKLGATLANSGRHEDAVHAYRRALSLAPGFVRARANLGIACHSLRAFDQALGHYAAALRLLQPGQLADSAVWGLARQTAARMAYEEPGLADARAAHAQRVSAIKALIDARDMPGFSRAVGGAPEVD